MVMGLARRKAASSPGRRGDRGSLPAWTEEGTGAGTAEPSVSMSMESIDGGRKTPKERRQALHRRELQRKAQEERSRRHLERTDGGEVRYRAVGWCRLGGSTVVSIRVDVSVGVGSWCWTPISILPHVLMSSMHLRCTAHMCLPTHLPCTFTHASSAPIFLHRRSVPHSHPSLYTQRATPISYTPALPPHPTACALFHPTAPSRNLVAVIRRRHSLSTAVNRCQNAVIAYRPNQPPLPHRHLAGRNGWPTPWVRCSPPTATATTTATNRRLISSRAALAWIGPPGSRPRPCRHRSRRRRLHRRPSPTAAISLHRQLPAQCPCHRCFPWAQVTPHPRRTARRRTGRIAASRPLPFERSRLPAVHTLPAPRRTSGSQTFCRYANNVHCVLVVVHLMCKCLGAR